MAFTFSAQYTPDAEDRMRGFYQTLSEKDQRRFAALNQSIVAARYMNPLGSGTYVMSADHTWLPSR